MGTLGQIGTLRNGLVGYGTPGADWPRPPAAGENGERSKPLGVEQVRPNVRASTLRGGVNKFVAMSKPKQLRLKRLFYRQSQHFNSYDAKNQLSNALSFFPYSTK